MVLTRLQVGELVHGGIVLYVDDTGQHRLVAALQDLEGTYEWGCSGTSISVADGASIGTGYINTLQISLGCTETTIGARQALNYEADGYDDWYLPSKDELVEMYDNIGPGENNLANLSEAGYWSSTEGPNNSSAFRMSMQNNLVSNESRNNLYKVRPIRSF